MKTILFVIGALVIVSCNPKIGNGLRKNDLKRDIELVTTKGTMLIRLSDSTPLHRDNFLMLVKQNFYDSILFHRVIKNFMIQAGDPMTKSSASNANKNAAEKTIPAEFVSGMFHHKGVLAAARMGDNVNPSKASSNSQFYIVHGKVFTQAGLDSVESMRMKGYRFPESHRKVYTETGGAPHLDQQYTIFGEVIRGLDIIDSIAIVKTSGSDRPVEEVRILKTKLVKRNKN